MIAAVVVTVAVLAWFGRKTAADWDSLSADLANASPIGLVGALALAFVFCVLIGLCYYNSLRIAGTDVKPVPAVSVYLASQLGKYVPGRVLYVAGHIGLARWLGITVPQAAMGFTVHHLVLVASGALIAAPLLGAVVRPGMANVLVVLVIAGIVVLISGVWVHALNALQRRRGKVEFVLASRTRVAAALGSSAAGWVCYGVAVIVVAVAITPGIAARDYLPIGMAAVAAWLVGFLSIIAPAGLGVREGAFVLLTRSIMPEANAMAVALIWRLLFTAVQVPSGAIALTVLAQRRSDRPGRAEDPSQ